MDFQVSWNEIPIRIIKWLSLRGLNESTVRTLWHGGELKLKRLDETEPTTLQVRLEHTWICPGDAVFVRDQLIPWGNLRSTQVIALYKPIGMQIAMPPKNVHLTDVSGDCKYLDSPRTMRTLNPSKTSDILCELPPGFVNVGRLDTQTSGLQLFTNDGDLLHALLKPHGSCLKRYICTFRFFEPLLKGKVVLCLDSL
jgi:hypothetical protein